MSIQELEALPRILIAALIHGAETYANGIGAEVPTVSRHFTAGNQGRYGWEPLSRDYFFMKKKGIVTRGMGSHFFNRKQLSILANIKKEQQEAMKSIPKQLRKAQRAHDKWQNGIVIDSMIGGRKGSRLDKAAQFNAGISGLVGSAKNLPMLVLTGDLKRAVSGPKHSVTVVPGGVRILFAGLPDYAKYLHNGTAKMPKRSPVEPGSADEAEIQAAIRRYLDSALKTGGAVPQSRTTVPGKARFV